MKIAHNRPLDILDIGYSISYSDNQLLYTSDSIVTVKCNNFIPYQEKDYRSPLDVLKLQEQDAMMLSP